VNLRHAASILTFALLGCSTVQSRMEGPPLYMKTSPVSAQAFNDCFVRATGNQNVNYLPSAKGGTFKATAGPQEYVFWLVSVDDLGTSRQITVRAVNSRMGRGITEKVDACLNLPSSRG
jgi:hypothetical protein